MFCDLCKSWEPCGKPGCWLDRGKPVTPRVANTKPIVTNSVTNAKEAVTNIERSKEAARQARKRSKDPEAYRAYQRELMRKRRSG